MIEDPDEITRAKVIHFKRDGKYYTEEWWGIPKGAIGPYDMDQSLDARRIGGGPVLVPSQEPWGYPFLFPALPEDKPDKTSKKRKKVIRKTLSDIALPFLEFNLGRGRAVSTIETWADNINRDIDRYSR